MDDLEVMHNIWFKSDKVEICLILLVVQSCMQYRIYAFVGVVNNMIIFMFIVVHRPPTPSTFDDLY